MEGPQWVAKNVLARSHRPGRFSYGSKASVPAEEVARWIDGVKALGAKSIICLLSESELAFYAGVPGGLLNAYRHAKLEVAHIAVEDHQIPPLTQPDLGAVWTAFQSLPKPVLVHCSAGVDRTGAAVEYIELRHNGGHVERA